jgi:hypothetical protein
MRRFAAVIAASSVSNVCVIPSLLFTGTDANRPRRCDAPSGTISSLSRFGAESLLSSMAFLGRALSVAGYHNYAAGRLCP